MAASYTPGASDKDRARLALGDTGPEFLLQDAEIADLQGLFGYVEGTAKAAEAIAAQFAARAQSVTDDNEKLDFGDRQRRFLELADRIRSGPAPGQQARTGVAGGFARSPDLSTYRSD